MQCVFAKLISSSMSFHKDCTYRFHLHTLHHGKTKQENKEMPFCNVCLQKWFHLKCLFTKTALIGFSCKHSLMLRQSKDIGKCLFAKIIKRCMQETPYNFPIKVSLLCIILPTKHKSGYNISLFFHPKVSFQCIIMPSTTKESLQYIYILYIKRVLVLSQQFIQKE